MEGNRERGWPSPRTWERVSLELELAEKNNLDRDLLHIIVEGLVGKGPALEFMAFIDWSAKAPDIKKMLEGEIAVKVPKRPDQRYAMLSAIVHHIRQRKKPEEILNGFFDIVLKFPNDWAQLIHHDVMLVMLSENNEQFIEEMMTHPSHEDLEKRIIV